MGCSNHLWFTNQIGICKLIWLLQESTRGVLSSKQTNLWSKKVTGIKTDELILLKTPNGAIVEIVWRSLRKEFQIQKPKCLVFCFFWPRHFQGHVPSKFPWVTMKKCESSTEVTFVRHSGTVTLASTGDAFPLMQRAQSGQCADYYCVFINRGLASLSTGGSGSR